MTAPHPSIVWQMRKTPETIAFVQEACVAYFTRGFRTGEQEALRQEIERLLKGEAPLVAHMTVDDWLDARRAAEREAWKAGKNAHVLAFVDEAEKSFGTVVPVGHWADLRDRITALKDGSAALEEPQTVVQWLESLKSRH